MKYPKLRELKEAIKALIKGPYTTEFPFKPHIPAARFRGKPIPYEKDCIGCTACAQVCPTTAIEVIDTIAQPSTRTLIWHYDDCIFCGQCEANCTTKKGVKLSQEFDLATLDRSTLHSDEVKKELVICSSCGEIIGPIDQILWISNKLGPMAYGNYSLYSTTQEKELQIFGATNTEKQTSLTSNHTRADLFKLQCPKCKYLVLQFDEFNK